MKSGRFGQNSVPPPPTAAGEAAVPGLGASCRDCELRAQCITYGWRSPAGVWFENAVMLRPRPGCRGFVGSGDDIRAHFSRGEGDRTH